MRRTRLLVALLLVVAACSGDDDDDASPQQTTSTTTTVEASTTTTSTSEPVEVEESLRLTAECDGIGELTRGGDVTYLEDGRVWAADGRCIAEYDGPARLSWGGAADRLLVGDRSVLLADGPSDVVAEGLDALTWSLPTGKAIVVRNERDELSKLSLVGDAPLDLAGVPVGLLDVEYHPSGTAIAGIEDLGPNIVLASNRGEDPRWLLQTEAADDITDMAFDAGGNLLFVARHDDEWHLHHLVLGDVEVTDVLVADVPIDGIVSSPLHEGAFAAARGTCEAPAPIYVEVDGEVRDLSDTPAAFGRPVGWTSGTGLVVLTCDGDLYVVTTTTPTLVAEGVDAAAVRIERPPPPAPPPNIEAAPA